VIALRVYKKNSCLVDLAADQHLKNSTTAYKSVVGSTRLT